MENLIEYKKLVRLRDKSLNKLQDVTSPEDKEELLAEINDIKQLMSKLESESDTVKQYLSDLKKDDNNDNSEIKYASSDSVKQSDLDVKVNKDNSTKTTSQSQDEPKVNKSAIYIFGGAFVFFVLLFFVIQCQSYLKQKKQEEKAAAELAFYNSPEQVKLRHDKDSIARRKKQIQKENHIAEIKSSIQVTKFMLSKPSCVGGCDLYAAFKNKSDKTVKYITFHFHALNAVGDVVPCTVRQSYSLGGKLTGPIKPGRNTGTKYWDAIIYNSSAKRPVLDNISIEYMDGSNLIVDEKFIKYVF